MKGYGREIMQGVAWMETPPQVPGDYLFRCGETPEVEVLKVYRINGSPLIVDSDIGKCMLQLFHDNLIQPEWAVAPGPDITFDANSQNTTVPQEQSANPA